METEPSMFGAEPLGDRPVGPAGYTEEPADKTIEEPADTTVEEDEDADVDFEDLKTVPKSLQKAAKKLQASFTKKMQLLSRIPEPKSPEANTPSVDTPEVEEVKKFMSTPQGSALKSVMEAIVSERLGDLPEKTMELTQEKEIEGLVKQYGEEAIRDNFDRIEQMSEKYPNVPLDLITSKVLFEQAKKMGEKEYLQRIKEKASNSMAPTFSCSYKHNKALLN